MEILGYMNVRWMNFGGCWEWYLKSKIGTIKYLCKCEIRDLDWVSIFYFIDLQNEEAYVRKKSSSFWWGIKQGVP